MRYASKIVGSAAVLATVTAFGAMAQTPAPAQNAPAATAAHKNMSMSMSRSRVEAIQTALKNNGEDVAPDGVWGPKTVTALRDFQKKQGLKATGHMDRATALKLNLPPHSA
jgi:peptidoglycan hydrolase-like protein with peptidoglycan-binding domain